MIESVKQIVMIKASDVPPTFDILVGMKAYPFEWYAACDDHTYIMDMTSRQIVQVADSEEIAILIPDTLENAQFDIEMDLMQRGVM